jgi:hypothetical protein
MTHEYIGLHFAAGMASPTLERGERRARPARPDRRVS